MKVLEQGPLPDGCTQLGTVHSKRGALQDDKVLDVDIRNQAADKGGNLVLVTHRTTLEVAGEIHRCAPPQPKAAEPQQEEPAELDDQARQLFVHGRDAYYEQHFEDALKYYRAAYQLSGRPELQYNIGQAADKLHRDAEALEAFEAYLKQAKPGEQRTAAQARAEQLRASVGSAAASRE